jgi:hypothetical protein
VSVNVGSSSSVVHSISLVVCPEPHWGAVQESSEKLRDITDRFFTFTRPFCGWRVDWLLTVVGVVCFFASVGQLPPPPTQAQDRSTGAVPETQTSVLPNPLTSTLTVPGVLPHWNVKTFMACAEALPGRAKPPIARATAAVHRAALEIDIKSSLVARIRLPARRKISAAAKPLRSAMVGKQPSLKFYVIFRYSPVGQKLE